MKNLKYFAVFTTFLLAFGVIAFADLASAANSFADAISNVGGTESYGGGLLVAVGIVIIVLLIIGGITGGCIYCNGTPTPPPSTNLGTQGCMDSCVENGGDDFDCLDQCTH